METNPRFTVKAVLIVTMSVASMLPTQGAAPPRADDAALEDIVAHVDRAPIRYRAIRRLEAHTPSSDGWLTAWTEFDAAGVFRYGVIDEGGSGRIRNSVLRAVLEAERDANTAPEMKLNALSPDNYEFQPGADEADDAMTLLLIPRRKDQRLINGALLLSRDRWEKVRLEGRLAKSPSFWIRSVNVSWRFERIGHVVMPVQLDSRAQVKIVGPSTFRMTYDYEMVDGSPVANAN